MGKAIGVALLFVVLAFGFVLFQLSQQAPRDRRPSARPGPVLEMREDGSVYAVSLQLSQFERRLMEEEKRSEQLLTELETMRGERVKLEQRLGEVQEDLRKLRRQLAERPAAPVPAPNGPASVVPAPNGPGAGPAPITTPEGQ
ncbi:MAG TPA: hypothetical protein VFU47_04190 [Armatimonadota bacterium]|nr:hypothetical protein [Armatimonadota bacterium]